VPIDLPFALVGTTIPLDHGYSLFSALSRIVPELHGDRRVGVHPIRGRQSAPGEFSLTETALVPVPGLSRQSGMTSDRALRYHREARLALANHDSCERICYGREGRNTPGPAASDVIIAT
jgi:Cas6 Crispr